MHGAVEIDCISGSAIQGHGKYHLRFLPLQGGGTLQHHEFIGEAAVGDFLRNELHFHNDAITIAIADLRENGKHSTGEIVLSNAEMERLFPIQYDAMRAAG